MSQVLNRRLAGGIGSLAVTLALGDVLPLLDEFVDDLAADLAADRISDYEGFVHRCRTFYTDERVARIDRVVSGWSRMASYRDGVTLWHTTAAIASLRTLDEYQDALTPTRHLMDWAVLLHDLAKEPDGRGRDHFHAFRSAAAAGRVLPALGFEVTDAWPAGSDAWYSLVESACRYDAGGSEYVQDNDQLSAIIEGADQLYGADAAIVLKAIALHLAVTVVADWPARTPLTRAEEQRFIDPPLAPVLLAMMLADHGGWNTFDAVTLRAYLNQTRAVFERF